MQELIEGRQEVLKYYSAYSFIRNMKDEVHLEAVCKSFHDCEQHTVLLQGSRFVFIYKKLPWDSQFFDQPIYKLVNVLFSGVAYDLLVEAIGVFLAQVQWQAQSIMSIEIPPEDIVLIQALGAHGFKLIESRLTYFHDSVKKFEYKRYNVKQATTDDIESLMKVAAQMRNNFDRFHADQTIANGRADAYLATYIKNSIEGFADYVMVPNEPNVPVAAFLTANYQKNEWDALGIKASKMVLSAVDTSCKGWYVKLISEMSYHLADAGADIVFMNTQTTNRAVIKTWEALGYKYGGCSHILSKNL